ncbi:hypothetical protein BCR33DRAFT_418865 [Rhizoclosmatium globosum]|uniref:Uncharacterized protein n=1 Tax=Rhizoclosmatium globosum TaxID=329046 RepID=A0A1Y2BWM9_9FUNG|nr:hypothetical protein BCR33DRAFT_418865 [Rhizoclosmatium globosum]|eukprot:ORY39153.1 hypothetical protein BCR33DRAFT_418865 [Rhizoclosmatium globosum]
MSSHPDVVSVEEETMFLSYPAQELVTSLNFMFHASKCVYNRPLLMLSSLPTFRPLTLRSEHRQIISSAIDQCLQSSRRILSLLSFFEDVHSGKRGDRQVPVKARWCYNPLFNQDSLFEAVLVFWFTCCRMNPEWWVYLSSPPLDSLAVHSSLKRSIESLKRQEIIEGSFSGYTTVFKDCMVFMLTDINKSIDTVTQTSGTDMEDLELGMKLTSLDGTIDIDATEETVEPWAFLGLLGVTLPCGIRWKGRSEDSWRLFWKLFK